MSKGGKVKVRHEGPVDWVTLDHAVRFNALTPDMAQTLGDYFSGLKRAHHTRVVVITGAGGNFCAGLDIKEHLPVLTAPADECLSFMEMFSSLIAAMRRCPQVTVAMLSGVASGGGLAMALASDLRLAADSLRMSPAFLRLGLSGAEMGISYLLPRLIGAAQAAEILLTGRSVDAPQALSLGLVSQVVAENALTTATCDVVTELLRTSPLAMRLTKEALICGLDAPSLDAAMALENRNQALCFQGGMPRKGVAAFREKRSADYPK